MQLINNTAAWQALASHWQTTAATSMREQFATNPARVSAFQAAACGIHLDYSKNLIDSEGMRLLLDLATTAGVVEWGQRLHAGDLVNNTEQRAVLHMALRHRGGRAYRIDGHDAMVGVRSVLAHMRSFSNDVRHGHWLGYTGQRITDVVNIGIGGSNLGPKMVCEALRPYQSPDLRVHFVSNLDGAHLSRVLARLNPATTLFVVASKTFTTLETLTNARSARAWCLASLHHEQAIASHFVAVSTNAEAVAAFGIDTDNMFAFWDWVGGRYSLWSAIGLPIALAIGMDNFEQLLAGGDAMDTHFLEAPLAQNLPVILAMLGVWYTNFGGHATHAVLPYDQDLESFPAFLQQLDMESNGKRVTRDGTPVDYATGPVVWGEPGTDSQHSFFQLIHQSPRVVPADFILPLHSNSPLGDHHDKLVANCLAQAQALMQGRTAAEVRAELLATGMNPAAAEALVPHKVFPGNRPSNLLVLDRVTPHSLGALIALYEYKVFVQGVVWGVNSYDQWGVELGKQLAGDILKAFSDPARIDELDASTAAMIRRYLAARDEVAQKG